MTGETIKSFLVGLGFGVDDASLSKFNRAIASATLKVTALYTSIKLMSAGIFYGISKISESFEEIGYQFRIIAPAINKTLQLRNAMLSAWKAAGINITEAVQQSVLFNFSLAKTKYVLEAIYKSVGLKFLPMLTKQMDIFRLKILANMPKIQASLQKFVEFIFKAFEATVILGTRVWSILGRVYEFFEKLDTATGGWSTKIIAVAAAWKFLNLQFLATPLGAIIAGILTLITLYDDFKVWQEGGESFFNWSSFVPVINAVTSAIASFGDAIGAAFRVAFGLFDVLMKLINLDFSGIKNTFSNMGDDLKDLGGSALAGVTSLFGGAQAAYGAATGQGQPLMGQGGGVSNKVAQETNIIVQGGADASSTGKAVASEQSKVNFDMVRNLKGATR